MRIHYLQKKTSGEHNRRMRECDQNSGDAGHGNGNGWVDQGWIVLFNFFYSLSLQARHNDPGPPKDKI